MLKKSYIILMLLAFSAVAIVFDTLPRSTKSLLEKRRLATFPEFSTERLFSGEFTSEVSHWFSDSEPFRDEIMAFSMKVKELQKVKFSENDITFITSSPAPAPSTAHKKSKDDRKVKGYKNKITADADAKMASHGIIIVGKDANVRALSIFGGNKKLAQPFISMVNKYHEALGDDVKLYCMVIPTAIEYYCPDKAKKSTNAQWSVINACYENINKAVKPVDVYTTLGKHAKENIFLRTDHHWTPLGGYYAAKQFAKVAGVKFKPIFSYTKTVVHGYVGTMYGYTRDASIKKAPEDFVYYKPNNIEYTTTYIDYLTKGLEVIGENKPMKGPFFYKYKDGSSGTYCTMMGGDMRLTKVETGTKNGRRVAILKDSFGNAIPAYLFYSFEEVHVIDHRYFTPNIVQYVKDNKITDFLIALNIYNVCSPASAALCEKRLTQ
ncbi:MAG: hypothetical protein HUK05_03795 [Prevotella sp.]|nr:hypothetical protein [Prevotella sp.]MCF0208368.1 hypothetical protein [Bacteroidaceae bacterium]